MKKILAVCLAFAASAFSVGAISAPGEYWEITSKMEIPGMPAMPTTTQKLCVGKGNEKDPQQSSKDCQVSDIKISGNKTSWMVRCNNRNGETAMTGSGEQTITMADNYQGTIHFSRKSGGRDINMTQSYSGKRLGGNCDTEEQIKRANEVKERSDKNRADMCDSSKFEPTGELISASIRYLETNSPSNRSVRKNPFCIGQKEQYCSLVSKYASSNADTYGALIQNDKLGVTNIAKDCNLNMAATTKSVCKKLNGENYHTLSAYCPAEAKAYDVAERKRQQEEYCGGRGYTGSQEDFSKCMGGDDSAKTGEEKPADNSSTKSAPAKSSTSNPAGAAIEGAKKLKGMFGF